VTAPGLRASEGARPARSYGVPSFDVVVPTLGRPSLTALLDTLGAAVERAGDVSAGPRRVVLVDDRDSGGPLSPTVPAALAGRVTVLRSGGAGPAAARNAGWQACASEWVAFLDDDVEVPTGWVDALEADLDACDASVGGNQGRIVVPLPLHRRPTDWERSTAGLQDAAWATADMAYRRDVLQRVGGFDERFPRAYREDADLALRVLGAGCGLTGGDRYVVHPVRPESPWVSLRAQRGNADDVLMRRLHGPDWRRRADAPPGRFRRHAAVVALAVGAATAAAARQRRTAAVLGLGWFAGTAEFAFRRLAPGPWTPDEVGRMLATSPLIPFAAVAHRVRGEWRHRAARPVPTPAPPEVVLFDRDGTLVHDVPYNGDPDLVRPVDTALPALRRLRDAGVRVGVVTNQSGVARGLLDSDQVRRVNARVEELLGPFDVWMVCPHDDSDGCSCRKPQPGMVLAAASQLGVRPERCAVIGDIGRDVEAAEAAGAVGVLVPTPQTLQAEVHRARHRAPDLVAAVDLLMGARP
jgi:HAD superfamily hydrolase (TIGR01662 family)